MKPAISKFKQMASCHTFLLIICLKFVSRTFELSGSNVCGKDDGDDTKLYCCYNFYEENGQCKECPTGTFSNDGMVCKPCAPDQYGYQCLYSCQCESCDPVHGCAATEMLSETKTSVNRHKEKLTDESNTHLVKQTQSTLFEDKKEDKLFNVYVLIVGGVVFLLWLGVSIYLIVTRTKKKRKHNSTDENSQPNAVFESIYNEIEDAPIENVLPNARHSYFSIKDEASSNNSLNADQRNDSLKTYINQPKKDACEIQSQKYDDCEIQYSCSDDSEGDCSDNAEQDGKSIDSVAGSSSVDSQENNRKDMKSNDGYLNPYNSLTAKADVHEYNKC